MKILVINCGSSSLKYQLINMADESVICKGNCERIGIDGSFITHKANGGEWKVETNFPTHKEAFAKVVEMMTEGEGKVIESKSEISAIGHRIVQGAEKFSEPCLVNDDVIQTIDDLSVLAPAHNKAHAIGLRSAKEVFGADVPNVVVFDTAFHATMPPKAYMYAVPYEFYEKHAIRRYGFHGTSHKFVSRTAAEYLGKKPEELKMITLHLGNGASLAAVDGGKVVDTSMGLTPLGGFMMGSRSGDLDPSVVGYISELTGIKGNDLTDYLTKKAGFLGVSGISSDCRDIEVAAAEGDEKAKLVLDMYFYQLQKFVGSYTAAMNGLDVMVFTAGIGENSASVREGVCEGLGYFGVEIDKEKNKLRGLDVNDITGPNSKVKVLVVATNEELMIARDTKKVVFGE
ncbi:MAG: acetate kinase [Oscillospiraceae bacterium]|nr:acetate kinase [Oscillospiraceae bacterium]MBP1570984.1 acetate kinase [Oscillospiraceae bacterium]MBQ5313486.1 acetate kinase [Oscillospiraceae bacterium]MBQ5324657.1 acetate kinase [Oscillospiraceae bacterium]